MNEQDTTRAKILGVLIQDARLHAGRSVEDCARVLQMDPEQFRQAEQGEYIVALPELEVLSMYLDVPMAHFWGSKTLGPAEEPDYAAVLTLRNRIVGALLYNAREQAGLSIEELAQRSDIDSEQLQVYEFGERPIPLLELEKLAKALNVSLDYFMDQERGPLARHERGHKMQQHFDELPPEVQAFVVEPVNIGYLETAMRLSKLDVHRLRRIAEGLLDITL